MNSHERPAAPAVTDPGGHGGPGIGDDRDAQDAFTHWYRASFARVRRSLTLTTGDAGLSEEATAEAFARALVHWRKLRDSPGRDAWVYRTALNLVRSRMRRVGLERRWAQRQIDRVMPPPPEPDTALWRAVQQLGPRARTAVALRYIADLSEADVATAMGITRGAAAATLHKARARLSVLLADAGLDERSQS